jgi:hypothetical protein
MSHRIAQSALGALVVGIASAALAQTPVYYPSKGQTTEQQGKDVGECQTWAKQNTGIDPAAVSSAPPPSSSAQGGQRVRGAARGAAGGAAIGAIAGDAGKGAAIGAAAGTVGGGRQARQAKAANQQQSAQAQSDKIATFNKAVAACMEGRGYVAK